MMPIEVRFIIYGNHENKLTGNPLPYTRTTQRGRWSPRAQRYEQWKSYVVASYLDTVAPRNKPFKKSDYGAIHDLLGKKPIYKNIKAKLVADIYFADETHPDPDNVVKGINDSLFQNDKHVDVETRHYCRQLSPRVEVSIYFL